MSFYQDFDIPPPIDDEDSKCEESDFNDTDLDHFDDEIDIDIPGSGIPQHHFYSSTPPPDDLNENFSNIEITSNVIEVPQLEQKHTTTTVTEDCDELLNEKDSTEKEEIEIKKIDENQDKNIDDDEDEKSKSVTHSSCTETESDQQPIKIESLVSTTTLTIDDDPDEFHFESFKIEGFKESEVVHSNISKENDQKESVEVDNDDEEFQFESFKAEPNNELSRDHFESFKAKGFSGSDEFIFESYQAEPVQKISDVNESQKSKCAEVQQFSDDIQFEADFSNFETKFPNLETFSSQINHSMQIKEQEESVVARKIMLDDDDDEDFGDFNDFTQAPSTATRIEIEPQPSSLSSFLTNKPEICKIIDKSFPYEKTEDEQQQEEEIKVLNSHLDDIMKYLKDIDVTLALNYEYKDSSTNNMLVKALGIDKRNILFGPKWNSSSSNVPRFASDLSFNPLQPQKSLSSTIPALNEKLIVKDTELANKQQQQQQQQQPQPDVIPEVDFDWNGAGLKNPLDAKQLKPTEEILSAKINSDVFESNFNKSETTNVTEEETVKRIWQDEAAFDISNHVIVRERVIKLPETHIFTPIKSVSPVAVSKDIPIDEIKIENTSTVYVKEYHDVEYSLDPPKYRSESESEFDEFQSAVVIDDTGLKTAITSEPSKIDILMPQHPESFKQPSVDVMKPMEILQSQSILMPQPNSDLLIPQKVNYTNVQHESKPSVNQQPDLSDDFDFTEFQAAPCVHQTITQAPSTTTVTLKEKQKTNSLTLSPMHLVNSYNTSNSDNNESKYLSNATKAEETNCDDDWSDFVSSTTPNTIVNSIVRNNDNAWSDFVSVPIKPSIKNSSQFPAKPNFSSWNQPVSRPYAVNHTTSFLSSYQPDVSERKVTLNKPMNITKNYSYGIDQHEKAYQHGMPNGISTILPDLQFAMPNNLINLSRANSANSSTSGKK